MEVEKRAGMKKYLSAHVLLAPLQFALSVWGLCIVQRRSSVPCASQLNYNNSLDVVLLSVVVISQLVDIVATLFAVYLFSVSNINDEDNVADEQVCRRIRMYARTHARRPPHKLASSSRRPTRCGRAAAARCAAPSKVALTELTRPYIP